MMPAVTADPFSAPLSFAEFLARVKREDFGPVPRADCPDCGQLAAWCECPDCNQGDSPKRAVRKPVTKIEHVEGVGMARVRDDGSMLRRAYSPRERAEAVNMHRSQGLGFAEIERQTGIPRRTVQAWNRRFAA